LSYNFLKVGCWIVGSFAAVAAPLDKARISSEAKWIVHIDVEGLRKTALGDYVITDLVQPALTNMEQLRKANLSMNVSNITSITAYGPAFDKGAEGVLMISTTADPKKDLDTVAGMFLAMAGTNAPFTLLEKDPYPLYTFSKSVYFTPFQHTLFVRNPGSSSNTLMKWFSGRRTASFRAAASRISVNRRKAFSLLRLRMAQSARVCPPRLRFYARRPAAG